MFDLAIVLIMDYAKELDKEPTAREQITVFFNESKNIAHREGTLSFKTQHVQNNQTATRINYLGRAIRQTLNMVPEGDEEVLNMVLTSQMSSPPLPLF